VHETPPLRLPDAELPAFAAGTVLVGEEAHGLAARAGAQMPAREARAGARAVLAVGAPRIGGRAGADPHALVPLYLQVSAPERRLEGSG
jgi:hypothetical protein